jgi:hypothetical protein
MPARTAPERKSYPGVTPLILERKNIESRGAVALDSLGVLSVRSGDTAAPAGPPVRSADTAGPEAARLRSADIAGPEAARLPSVDIAAADQVQARMLAPWLHLH